MQTICTGEYRLDISDTISIKQRFVLFLQNVNRKGCIQKECSSSAKAMAMADGKWSNCTTAFIIQWQYRIVLIEYEVDDLGRRQFIYRWFLRQCFQPDENDIMILKTNMY